MFIYILLYYYSLYVLLVHSQFKRCHCGFIDIFVRLIWSSRHAEQSRISQTRRQATNTLPFLGSLVTISYIHVCNLKDKLQTEVKWSCSPLWSSDRTLLLRLHWFFTLTISISSKGSNVKWNSDRRSSNKRWRKIQNAIDLRGWISNYLAFLFSNQIQLNVQLFMIDCDTRWIYLTSSLTPCAM